MRALDPERFEALRRDFPRSALGDILETFAVLTAATIDELAVGVAARDAGRTRDAAHKLRGGCLAIGAMQLAQVAGELEREALAGRVGDDADALLVRVQDGWALLREELAAL